MRQVHNRPRDSMGEDDLLMSLPETVDDTISTEDAYDSPRDRSLIRFGDGQTPRELRHAPSLASLLAREIPEPRDAVEERDWDELDEPDDTGAFAGRLIVDSADTDVEYDHDVASAIEDEGGYSAEEAAVHIVRY